MPTAAAPRSGTTAAELGPGRHGRVHNRWIPGLPALEPLRSPAAVPPASAAGTFGSSDEESDRPEDQRRNQHNPDEVGGVGRASGSGEGTGAGSGPGGVGVGSGCVGPGGAGGLGTSGPGAGAGGSTGGSTAGNATGFGVLPIPCRYPLSHRANRQIRELAAAQPPRRHSRWRYPLRGLHRPQMLARPGASG